MRHFFVIIFLIFCLNVFGQKIGFNLYIYNPCVDSIYSADCYRLILKNDSNVYFVSDSMGFCILPDTGIYRLLVFNNVDDENKLYYFKTTGSYNDTITIQKVYGCYEPTSKPGFYGYCCCDKICDGYQIDYYANGKIKFEGLFKNGQPLGELKYYYPSGKIKRIEHYYRFCKKIKILTYTENGIAIKE
jgi:hypothetical protein